MEFNISVIKRARGRLVPGTPVGFKIFSALRGHQNYIESVGLGYRFQVFLELIHVLGILEFDGNQFFASADLFFH